MIARHENNGAGVDDIWARIAAPLPKEAISWRQDGRPVTRDGKYFARFVSYTDAQFVRERLDSVVPGEWNLSLEMLPTLANVDGDGVFDAAPFGFKARLEILGVAREDVGVGKDYKQASTDAFKRAAVRFGVGHELYDMDMLWVQMDGDGKYAKPVEDPQAAYDRKHGGKQRPAPTNGNGSRPTSSGAGASPEDMLMPMGKTRGKRLGDLETKDLESAAAWCREKGKFADLVENIGVVLANRASAANGDSLFPGDDDEAERPYEMD